ncbi:MAG TPA: acyl-CoA dehydrogenase family protein [Blastocatellia bacterium]|nr:acyl-CoA dehydrogenase family protein [Blastocatellia bacterium]
MSRLRDFQGIEGQDFFEMDLGFQSLLKDLLPEDEHSPVFNSLHHCARMVGGRWNDLAREASTPGHLPRIVKFDRVGGPVEQVDFGSLTRHLRREIAEFGVLTDVRSEVHKFAMVYLLAHNGEASVNCGLSCTDGLIRAVEARGSEFLRETYLPLMLSVDTPLAGAQFVTEQDGGSDVGAIETEAKRNPDGTWSITGEKWFCSNPDEYFLVAARPAGAPRGTAGVAIFFVPRVLPDGQLNKISFKRLKDKLGTQSLPTAEMDFNQATAWAIGEPADGFKTLMNYVIDVSRIHNAANAGGILHRAFLEARNYAGQREAFGQAIIQYPLIQETLVRLLERLWRYRLLTFKLVALVDLHGIVAEDPGQAMWQRFLVNLAKYRTAVTLTDSVREAVLVFGGNGICEDFTVLPRLLRDSMIIETWEGAHNTLCLQIMRDAGRSDLMDRWRSEVNDALERWPADFLSLTRKRFERALAQLNSTLTRERLTDRSWAETHARRTVERLGALLELAWMADAAARHAESDSTAALLTSAAAYNLLPADDQFEHPIIDVISKHGLSLIEERPLHVDVRDL